MKFSKLFPAVAVLSMSLFFSCGGGDEKKDVHAHGYESGEPTTPETSPIAENKEGATTSVNTAKGKALYEKNCLACHQADGKGVPNTFPPLAGSDYLAADISRAISGVLNGLTGEITVNGNKYNSAMPATTLTDDEVAEVFTYVLNDFGNKGGTVTAAEVKALRK